MRVQGFFSRDAVQISFCLLVKLDISVVCLVGSSSRAYVFENEGTKFWSVWPIGSFCKSQTEILLAELNSFSYQSKVELHYFFLVSWILRQRMLTYHQQVLALSGKLFTQINNSLFIFLTFFSFYFCLSGNRKLNDP